MVNPQIADYVMQASLRLNDHQKKLFEKTKKTGESLRKLLSRRKRARLHVYGFHLLEGSYMIGSLDMVQHFQLILKAIGAKRCIEIGTFTGYTTLSIAQTLPEDGEIIACDVIQDHICFDIWKEAKVDHKVNGHQDGDFSRSFLVLICFFFFRSSSSLAVL